VLFKAAPIDTTQLPLEFFEHAVFWSSTDVRPLTGLFCAWSA
jgi:hypothetical protein